MADLLTPQQAAQRAKVSRPTIVRALQDRQISADRDNRGRWMIAPEAIDEWLSRRETPAPTVHLNSVHEQHIATLTTEVEALKKAVAERDLHIARLEGEANSHAAQIAAEIARREDTERDRDRWHQAAEAARSDLAAERSRSDSQNAARSSTARPGLLARLFGR